MPRRCISKNLYQCLICITRSHPNSLLLCLSEKNGSTLKLLHSLVDYGVWNAKFITYFDLHEVLATWNVKNRIFCIMSREKIRLFQPFICITKRRLNFVYFHFFLRVVFCGSSSCLFKNIFLRLLLRAPVWCLKKANIHPHHSICLRKTFKIISNQYVYLHFYTMRQQSLVNVLIQWFKSLLEVFGT